MKQLVRVHWRDSCIVEDDTQEPPNIAIMNSVGWLIRDEQTEGSIAICRDWYRDPLETDILTFRGVCTIPRENIIHFEHLD